MAKAIKTDDAPTEIEASVLKSPDVGYTEKPMDPEKGPKAKDDANMVLVQAVRSFEGIEGDKGPASEPFLVSRQRYADLKANSLVELVSEDDK
jgi:hypothetical protein